MKLILMIGSLFSASLAFAGGAEVIGGVPHPIDQGWSQPQAVPVADVSVVYIPSGCGIPGPGSNCPAVTHVAFTVAIGGSCHRYSLQPYFSQGRTVLMILDSVERFCTRPEEQNHRETISMQGDLGRAPVFIGNPVYIRTTYRP